jgi:hypothetical protein
MGQITVNRGKNFIGMARDYKIYLNDQEVGRVKNNSSTTIQVEPGKYEMRVGISKLNGMSNSIEGHVNENDDLAFITKMSKTMIVSYVCVFLGGAIIGLSSGTKKMSMVILGLILAVCGLFMTFRHNIVLQQTV